MVLIPPVEELFRKGFAAKALVQVYVYIYSQEENSDGKKSVFKKENRQSA